MLTKRIIAGVVLLIGILLGYSLFYGKTTSILGRQFHLGLDLSGGTSLLYKADVALLPQGQINESMETLRDIIEKRVNAFGVGEPVVQVQKSNMTGTMEHRLSVELPGVTDITEAIKMIGQTPYLEFKIIDDKGNFINTELTGKYLKRASLMFSQSNGQPEVSLIFNDDGAVLFEKITGENIGKPIAIFLDGKSIIDTTGDSEITDEDLYAPVVQSKIAGGQAVISGNLDPLEGKTLVGRLNSGALPVPISLIQTQSVGAILGIDAVNDGVKAGVVGFVIIALFLTLWYRLPGFIASIALLIYVFIVLALYKLIPVTLSAAGMAGFIISIGIAVDANILIFERFREERQKGKSITDAIESGFDRAWFSIRDANISAILVAIVLYWFGTSLIKGFALTLGLGVLVSMISSITITRIFLRAVPSSEDSKLSRVMFNSGFK